MPILKPTNMFILIKPKTIINGMHTSTNTVTSMTTTTNELSEFYSDFFQPRTQLYLPKTCKTTNINIINNFDIRNLNSQDILIFNDISNEECGDVHENADPTIAHEEHKIQLCEDNAAEEIWYESNVFIKGFKDILVNGKNIWNNF